MPLPFERKWGSEKRKKEEKERKEGSKKEKKKKKAKGKDEESMEREVEELRCQLIEEKQNTRREKLTVARLQKELVTVTTEATMKETLAQALVNEQEAKVEAESQLATALAENEAYKAQLVTLKSNLLEAEKTDQGKTDTLQPCPNGTGAGPNNNSGEEPSLVESQTTLKELQQEKSLLLERLRQLETENTALVLEGEKQQELYERCLDEVANQVVQALLMQRELKEECVKLRDRVEELEIHNHHLRHLFEQERLRHKQYQQQQSNDNRLLDEAQNTVLISPVRPTPRHIFFSNGFNCSSCLPHQTPSMRPLAPHHDSNRDRVQGPPPFHRQSSLPNPSHHNSLPSNQHSRTFDGSIQATLPPARFQSTMQPHVRMPNYGCFDGGGQPSNYASTDHRKYLLGELRFEPSLWNNSGNKWPLGYSEAFLHRKTQSLPTTPVIQRSAPYKWQDKSDLGTNRNCFRTSEDKYTQPYVHAPLDYAQSLLRELQEIGANVKSFESLTLEPRSNAQHKRKVSCDSERTSQPQKLVKGHDFMPIRESERHLNDSFDTFSLEDFPPGSTGSVTSGESIETAYERIIPSPEKSPQNTFLKDLTKDLLSHPKNTSKVEGNVLAISTSDASSIQSQVSEFMKPKKEEQQHLEGEVFNNPSKSDNLDQTGQNAQLDDSQQNGANLNSPFQLKSNTDQVPSSAEKLVELSIDGKQLETNLEQEIVDNLRNLNMCAGEELSGNGDSQSGAICENGSRNVNSEFKIEISKIVQPNMNLNEEQIKNSIDIVQPSPIWKKQEVFVFCDSEREVCNSKAQESGRVEDAPDRCDSPHARYDKRMGSFIIPDSKEGLLITNEDTPPKIPPRCRLPSNSDSCDGLRGSFSSTQGSRLLLPYSRVSKLPVPQSNSPKSGSENGSPLKQGKPLQEEEDPPQDVPNNQTTPPKLPPKPDWMRASRSSLESQHGASRQEETDKGQGDCIKGDEPPAIPERGLSVDIQAGVSELAVKTSLPEGAVQNEVDSSTDQNDHPNSRVLSTPSLNLPSNTKGHKRNVSGDSFQSDGSDWDLGKNGIEVTAGTPLSQLLSSDSEGEDDNPNYLEMWKAREASSPSKLPQWSSSKTTKEYIDKLNTPAEDQSKVDLHSSSEDWILKHHLLGAQRAKSASEEVILPPSVKDKGDSNQDYTPLILPKERSRVHSDLTLGEKSIFSLENGGLPNTGVPSSLIPQKSKSHTIESHTKPSKLPSKSKSKLKKESKSSSSGAKQPHKDKSVVKDFVSSLKAVMDHGKSSDKSEKSKPSFERSRLAKSFIRKSAAKSDDKCGSVANGSKTQMSNVKIVSSKVKDEKDSGAVTSSPKSSSKLPKFGFNRNTKTSKSFSGKLGKDSFLGKGGKSEIPKQTAGSAPKSRSFIPRVDQQKTNGGSPILRTGNGRPGLGIASLKHNNTGSPKLNKNNKQTSDSTSRIPQKAAAEQIKSNLQETLPENNVKTSKLEEGVDVGGENEFRHVTGGENQISALNAARAAFTLECSDSEYSRSSRRSSLDSFASLGSFTVEGVPSIDKSYISPEQDKRTAKEIHALSEQFSELAQRDSDPKTNVWVSVTEDEACSSNMKTEEESMDIRASSKEDSSDFDSNTKSSNDTNSLDKCDVIRETSKKETNSTVNIVQTEIEDNTSGTLVRDPESLSSGNINMAGNRLHSSLPEKGGKLKDVYFGKKSASLGHVERTNFSLGNELLEEKDVKYRDIDLENNARNNREHNDRGDTIQDGNMNETITDLEKDISGSHFADDDLELVQVPVVNREILEENFAEGGIHVHEDGSLENGGENEAQLSEKERATLLDSLFETDSDDEDRDDGSCSQDASELTRSDSHPDEREFMKLLSDNKALKRQVVRQPPVQSRVSLMNMDLSSVFTRFGDEERKALSSFDFLEKVVSQELPEENGFLDTQLQHNGKTMGTSTYSLGSDKLSEVCSSIDFAMNLDNSELTLPFGEDESQGGDGKISPFAFSQELTNTSMSSSLSTGSLSS